MKIPTIKAVCVPVIDMHLTIDALPAIVEGFLDKGYTLADKFLNNKSNVINNVKLILGADSDYLLSISLESFGIQT